MSNLNRACCRLASLDPDSAPPGPCCYCDAVQCAGCGQFLPAAETYTVHWVPGEHAPGRLCLACVAGDDSDGVPEEVEEEQTVAERTTWDRDALALVTVDARRAA